MIRNIFLFCAIVFYLLLHSANWVLYQTLRMDSHKNTVVQGGVFVRIPITARVGEEIPIEVFYLPTSFHLRLFEAFFADRTKAYDLRPQKFSYHLSLMPFYKKFTYTIPRSVCPQQIVYDTCNFVQTAKGFGTIRVVYDPEINDFLGGEGYQGDGEVINVPIEIQ